MIDTPLPSIDETSLEQADAIAARLHQRKDTWLNISLTDRITYLQHCLDDVMTVASDWAAVACRAKSIDPASPLAGEEWFVGPTATVAALRSLIVALEAKGQPRPVKLRTRANQTIAQVLPANWMERLLWLGFVGEVWLQPEYEPTQGRVYRQKPEAGTVALVLGAGNVSSIAPLDALYKLFAEDAVVLLKMNPVNAYMGAVLEKAFRSLRQDGFLEIVYGGAELGRHLCQHPLIETIHITGSHHTHDAIVWGSTPDEQAQRKAARQPLIIKPVTSELGCVTPVIVVPGHWSEADLAFQARHIAGMVAHNASFNCAAAKVIVTANGWTQREAFLAKLQQELAQTPARKAYYPGASERYQAFLERYPQAIALGTPTDTLPWTLILDVPAQIGEYALTQEAFCGVLAEVSLPAADAEDFLSQAIAFVNEQVWGNLSCTLLVDPQTEQQLGKGMEDAIAQLRYGAIGINVWSAVLFSLPIFSWGAFPGNSLQDITSGRGVVHNAYLFDHPQKSVLRAPFRGFPLPIWFARHRNLLQLARRFTVLQAAPSWISLLKVVLAALQS
ncbi:MAG: aldehyde dehydrogenase family protein [Stenomitos rutilans HA7619-LM2]|jgi:acyl-CoA reductase-like NAD-dependent aldehyde dehydrogenase|nr:aldehyde dehydrogenase family protein [Stenomitos rutilans HA7619-LM2]